MMEKNMIEAKVKFGMAIPIENHKNIDGYCSEKGCSEKSMAYLTMLFQEQTYVIPVCELHGILLAKDILVKNKSSK